ncbi:MAG: hypothetical protein ABIX01_12825 [Chitinophagaceae bacterium]
MNCRNVVRIFLSLLGLFARGSAVFAKNADSLLLYEDKMWQYVHEHPSTDLFLHTDKNIYSPNERVWFKGYVLSGSVADNKVLYVRLIDEKKNVQLRAQFPVYGLMSHGDLLLPDTLKDGKYFLYAYGDRMINFSPGDVFAAPIIIHKNKKKWRAEASVIDTAKLVRGEKVELLVRLKENNDLVKNVRGHYQLLDEGKVVKQGGLKTNIVGEAFIAFTYPVIADDHTLKAVINFEDDNDYEEVTLNISHSANKLKANIFPEGGRLLSQALNNMAIEMLDVNDLAVMGNVVLLANNKPVQTATTDSTGIALVSFVPARQVLYSVILDNMTRRDTVPLGLEVEDAGYLLSAAVTKDTCYVAITNHGPAGNIDVVLRSFDNVLWTRSLSLQSGAVQQVEIPLSGVVQQVMSVALINEKQQVLSERLLLSRPARDVQLNIQTDKVVYGTRKKMTVSVTTTDRNGIPVATNFSVSAVEVNTIDSISYPDIVNHLLFRNIGFGNQHPLQPKASGIDKQLLARNWNNYSWQNMLSYQPMGTLRLIRNSDGVYGTVTPKRKKKGLKLTDLPILSKAGLSFTTVNDNGNFNIPSADLISEKNERKKILLGAGFYDDYAISFKTYDEDFDKAVVGTNAFDFPSYYSKLSRYTMDKLEKIADPHLLQNVTIKVTKDIPWGATDYISSSCNDYVCMYNILNCPNHHFGTPPVVGETYTLLGRRVVYRGSCGQAGEETRPLIPLKLISNPNIFQVIDFEKEESNEVESRTTIYWNPNLSTGKDGKGSFTFFTDDVVGEFRITLQGVTLTGLLPLSGSARFTVKP